MRLRILQILEKNRFDTGSVHQMFQAAIGLAERGHEVAVVSRPGSEIAEKARKSGLAFIALPFRHELDLESIRRLRDLVDTRKPHVIHVHKGLSHTLALAATWSTQVPAFVVNRGVSFGLTVWNRPKYRTKRVDRIVAVCEGIRQVVIRTGKVSPTRVDVVYAGTDVTLFDPGAWPREPFRAEQAIPPEDFLFMQTGVRDWKGWRELIDAFALVSASRPGLRLALIACRTEEERKRVEDHARNRGAGDKVIAVEYRKDMPNVLAAADCIVDASWSGTGITGTIREAMALAKPVIATDCGGNRELVSSGSVGWIVPPRNRDAMVAAFEDVLAEPVRAREIGRNARERVVESFSRSARIDRLEKLYHHIVRQKASA